LTTTARGRYLLQKELNMSDSNPFVGTWKLVSWEVKQPDGTTHYLYGRDVVGYLIREGAVKHG
jgi:hypothetical protein